MSPNDFDKLRFVARRALLPDGARPRPIWRRLGRWVLGRRDRPVENSWRQTCLAWGLMHAHRATGALEDAACLGDYLHALLEEDGRWKTELRSVEQCMIGSVLLYLSEPSAAAEYRVAAEELVRFLLTQHPRTNTGVLPYNPACPTVMLVDTLPMICPFLAEFGNRYERDEATRLAISQTDEFLQRGMYGPLGIPFHGYDADGADGLGIVGWARGTGWLAVALVDTLAQLRPGHPARSRFSETLRNLLAAVGRFQRADGLWRWAITYPVGEIDTSGTALLGYAVERGLALGILEDGWCEVSEKALLGILRFTRPNGTVDMANRECQGPGLHPGCAGPAPWAQGPTIALAALVLSRTASVAGSVPAPNEASHRSA